MGRKKLLPSMYEPATLKGESNETITHGFSVLSLTIVAAKTILHSLNENDNISVVTYSSEAKTIFAPSSHFFICTQRRWVRTHNQ